MQLGPLILTGNLLFLLIVNFNKLNPQAFVCIFKFVIILYVLSTSDLSAFLHLHQKYPTVIFLLINVHCRTFVLKHFFITQDGCY